MKKIFIGIDISNLTLDICIKKDGQLQYFTIHNQIKAIKAFFKKHTTEGNVIAMENTGRYNWNLYEVLASSNFQVYIIPPVHLKMSLGLSRGKNDKVDALRICSYIEKNQAESIIWKPSSIVVRQLKVLLTERQSRIKMKSQLIRQQYDYRLMKTLALDKDLLSLNKQLIKAIEIQILKIEADIEKSILGDQELKKQSELIKSVPGVGKVVSWTLIAKTEGFTTISDSRKLACYCGVAPFDYQSGEDPGYRCLPIKI